MGDIAVTCQGADTLPIDAIVDFQHGLKSLSKANLEKLQKSILKYGFTAPIFIWQHAGDNYILDGHQRLSALLDLRERGHDIPLLPVAYIQAADEKEAKEKLLHISSQYGSLDKEGFKEFILDLDFDDLELSINLPDMRFRLDDERRRNISDFEFTDDLELCDEAKEIIEANDPLYFTYSGGKDSTLTAFLMRRLYPQKKFIFLHVDTGAEFPDLIAYVLRVADSLDAQLQILKPKDHIIEHYHRKKRFPYAINRDCLHRYINDPVDAYMKENTEVHIIFRGGRLGQATWKTLERLEDNNGQVTHYEGRVMVNPIANLTDEAFERMLTEVQDSIGLWPGYAKGFVRTACWFYPFQRKVQYKALKENYPLLFEELVRMRNTWEMGNDLGVEKHITAEGRIKES